MLINCLIILYIYIDIFFDNWVETNFCSDGTRTGSEMSLVHWLLTLILEVFYGGLTFVFLGMVEYIV